MSSVEVKRDMSQVAWFRVKLALPIGTALPQAHKAEAFLKRAVEIMAREHRGSVGTHLVSLGGRRAECFASVEAPDIPGGVGILLSKTSGQVELLFDARRAGSGLAQRLHDEIVQNYVGLAVASCMKDLGYRVTEEPSDASLVRLLGVA